MGTQTSTPQSGTTIINPTATAGKTTTTTRNPSTGEITVTQEITSCPKCICQNISCAPPRTQNILILFSSVIIFILAFIIYKKSQK